MKGKKMKRVHELRKAGNVVRVFHHRLLQKDEEDERGYSFSPRGGRTEVLIKPINNPDMPMIISHAFCSNKDNYNKKLGVQIALGRALKFLNDNDLGLQ